MDDAIVVRVTSDVIGVADANDLARPADGALVVFSGVVREQTEGAEVSLLEYEAYNDLAVEQMTKIATEARSRWDIGRVLILHRTGSLGISECSVIVAVSAPHRAEAFDAAEFCIDTLKQQAAIWKKEVFADGSSNWVNHP